MCFPLVTSRLGRSVVPITVKIVGSCSGGVVRSGVVSGSVMKSGTEYTLQKRDAGPGVSSIGLDDGQ